MLKVTLAFKRFLQGLDDILGENDCRQFNYFSLISRDYLVVWDTNTTMGSQVVGDRRFLDSPVCNHWHDIRMFCEEVADLAAGFEADRFIAQALASPFCGKIEENCFQLAIVFLELEKIIILRSQRLRLHSTPINHIFFTGFIDFS